MRKARLTLATVLAVLALLDNISTILAVEKGAREINPIVNIFLQSYPLFALFTAVKVFLCFYVVYRTFTPSRTWLAVYLIILAVFVRATVVNMLNALR